MPTHQINSKIHEMYGPSRSLGLHFLDGNLSKTIKRKSGANTKRIKGFRTRR